MKRILITGVNSYVGNSLAKWLAEYPASYSVDKISLRDGTWIEKDFSVYDTVVHVAGIAHVSKDPKMEEKYYQVNRDLTIEVAKKAKEQGVRQFIYLSSIIVYGNAVGKDGVITKDTQPDPSDFYGNSKLLAEQGIEPLNDNCFKVVIIRPPMIYGKDSKGNYPKLAKAAQKLPVFPNLDNKRSMLHIDNLSEFIKLMIDNVEEGLFFPQNKEYVKTSEMVKIISEVHGKKISLTKLFNPILHLMLNRINIINKVFGNLVYEKDMSEYKHDYQVYDQLESLMKTETKVDKHNSKNANIDILLMADNSLETVGGEQESTKIIINGTKDFYSLGVIYPGDVKKPISGVHYYPLTTKTRIKHLIKNPLAFILYIWKVKKVVNKNKPKVIHTQAQVSFIIVALLKKVNLISKHTTLIHTERGLYTKYSKYIIKTFFVFMTELDVLVTTTKFNMEYWKRAVLNKEISMDFKIIENTAGALFEVYDSKYEKNSTNQLVLGFAGRYADWKNWPLAVEITKKLNQRLGDKLIVNMAVGCLDDESEKKTKEIFESLSDLLGGRFSGKINIDIKEMDQFYYNLDIFILTSDYNTESFGRTLVEAMSRKTVVLTTDAGGAVEVVHDDDKVFYSAEQFVDKCYFLLTNSNEMEKIKEYNLKRVRDTYSLENNIIKHLELYKKYNKY